MNDLDDLELFYLRKKLNEEVAKICPEWPEAKHFEAVKPKILPEIAYKLWEKNGKPQNHDIDVWLDAENVWNFIRYGWA